MKKVFIAKNESIEAFEQAIIKHGSDPVFVSEPLKVKFHKIPKSRKKGIKFK